MDMERWEAGYRLLRALAIVIKYGLVLSPLFLKHKDYIFMNRFAGDRGDMQGVSRSPLLPFRR